VIAVPGIVHAADRLHLAVDADQARLISIRTRAVRVSSLSFGSI
jgi:hypothetical protein